MYFRTAVTKCPSDKDFLAKLYGIRLAFDKLLTSAKKNWFINEGRKLYTFLMILAKKVSFDGAEMVPPNSSHS